MKMGSVGLEDAELRTWGRGSNRTASHDAEEILQLPSSVDCKRTEPEEDYNSQRSEWRKFFSFVGPGFLISMAYLDPNNLETDLQAGGNHGYELLWVILMGTVFALIIQSRAANLGVVTGKHLAELCKIEYPTVVRYCLWLLAEVAVIAADIPEVIGTAIALNLLFPIPLWAGVLLTGSNTLLLIGLQRYGMRKLELLIAMLVLLMASCFFAEISYVNPPARNVVKGMIIPKLSSHGATGDAIALFGSLVNPHNFFLHSALVLSREVPRSRRGINSSKQFNSSSALSTAADKLASIEMFPLFQLICLPDACRFFLIESGLALFVAFSINVAVVSVSGTVCSSNHLIHEDSNRCEDLNLKSASFLLKNALGKSSKTVYAIALLASGQSSTITGTYAGQYIMQGFLDLKMRKWVRNLLTRTIAITPSMVVVIIGGSKGASRLIIIVSMILSFVLPFVMIPLLKFSSSSNKMGPHRSSIFVTVISWILGAGIIGINMYFLCADFIKWLLNNELPKPAVVVIGFLVFSIIVIYVVAVSFLVFRKDTVVAFADTTSNISSNATIMEEGS